MKLTWRKDNLAELSSNTTSRLSAPSTRHHAAHIHAHHGDQEAILATPIACGTNLDYATSQRTARLLGFGELRQTPIQHSSTLRPTMESDVLLVKPMQHGCIYVELRNGSKGICDLTSLLMYEAFEALQEPSYFSLASIVGGSVTWPNGEDLAPETVTAFLQPQAA